MAVVVWRWWQWWRCGGNVKNNLLGSRVLTSCPLALYKWLATWWEGVEATKPHIIIPPSSNHHPTPLISPTTLTASTKITPTTKSTPHSNHSIPPRSHENQPHTTSSTSPPSSSRREAQVGRRSHRGLPLTTWPARTDCSGWHSCQ